MLRSLPVAIVLATLPATAPAHPSPHVHGMAQLQLALVEQALEIELTSPALDLLGFEHAPRTPAERERLAAALAQLRDIDRVVELPAAARCTPEPARIDAGHEHEHEHEQSEHRDITVHYRFHCAAPQRLTRLKLTLFATFPAIERVRSEWLTAGAQGAKLLMATDPQLPLQP
jgi:hypothetical protein